jgi:PAS domain-containing protein
MQNEALSAAYQEISTLRDRYRDLYDFAPVAYFTVTPVGEITELNLRAAAMLNEPRTELLGRRLNDFMHAESTLLFADLLAAACEGTGEVVAILALAGAEETCIKAQAQLARSEITGTVGVRVAIMSLNEIATLEGGKTNGPLLRIRQP